MDYQIILMTIIVLFAFLTGLGFIFNLLLAPINEKLSILEKGQAKLEMGQAKLETGQARLEHEIKSIKSSNRL